MKKICKKLLVLATTLSIAGSAFALGGCNYTRKALADNPETNAEVTSQGGWVVKKGDWIYFVNGRPTGTATNTGSEGSDEESSAAIYENQFGEINKGALMRIKESDLNAGKYDEAETVVPLVVTGENYDSGIYIYGDYVYYATPTVAKDLSGNVQSGYVDFKCSALDGSKTMKDYYFRSSDSTARYRYVEVGGVVYCLHVDGSDLRSYNTKTGEDVLLVKSGSSYTFNEKDQSDPYVYYTMSVTVGVDSQASVAQDYNQVYRVRADATAALSVSKGTATIEVSGGEGDAYTKEYTFDADYLEEADQKDETDDFSESDVETYPYVNLGRLVLDGIGGGSVVTQYNQQDTDPSVEKYSYSLVKYDNDGLYYTRSAIISVGSSSGSGALYYLGENAVSSASWNAIKGNEAGNSDLIAKSSNTVSASAYFYKDGDTHCYIYSTGSKIYRAEVKADGEKEELCIADNTTASKFLATASDGEYSYIYYTVDGSASSSVCRAVYDSTAFDGKSIAEQQAYYNRFVSEENAAYQPTAIYYVGHILSWYAPEIIGNNLYFVSGETVGSVAYDYAHVTSLATNGKVRNNAEQKEENDKLDELNSLLAKVSSGMSNANNLIQYYYFTGETELFEEVLKYYEDEGYTSTYKFSQREQDCFDAYIKGNDYVVDAKTTYEFSKIKDFNERDYFYHRIGLISEDEQDALNEAWKLGYLQGVVETEEGLETWQWALIGVAIGVGALGIICAVTIPLVLHHRKNKIKEEGAVEKRKKYTVDMTYDENIDVYDMGANDPTEEGKATEAEVEALNDASDVAPVIEEVSEETPAETEAPAENEAVETPEDKE